MEFTARDDIEAPIDYVFQQVTDFASFERSIMRRGGDVERIAGGDAPELGTKWLVKFLMRGKERTVNAAIVQVEKPNGLTVAITSSNADGSMTIELVALAKARTRLIVAAEAGAKSIPAKLFFQSIRFARAKTEKRYQSVVSGFAQDVESKYRSR